VIDPATLVQEDKKSNPGLERTTNGYTRMDEDPFAPGKGQIDITDDDLPF
jgi:single-stranded DNA-binding protein